MLDLYTLAHKPLRLAVSDAAILLGADASDAVERATAAVEELLAHAEHEDRFIDPVLVRFLPDHALEIHAQHHRLGATIDAVRRQLDSPASPLATYRAFQRMAAANLLHLDHEETVVMPALWAAAPEAALSDVMAAFNAAHPDAVELFRRHPAALTSAERSMFGIDAA